MPSWADRLRSWFGRPTRRVSGPDVYHGLRAIATATPIESFQRPPNEPSGGVTVAMMEIGFAKGTATIVAIADGTVSMYTSAGGGVMGAGAHAAVRGAADRFRAAAFDARGLLQPTGDFPLPEPGTVRFHARTADGDLTGVASEEALRTRRHPLSELYAAGQDLVTEIRLSSPDSGAS